MKYHQRTIKSRLSLLLAVLMLTATVSSCHAGDGHTTDTTNTQTIAEVTDMSDTTDILEMTAPEEETATEPEETTSEPEVTTTEPETTVTDPEVTTTEPEATTTEPEETMAEPEVTTTEPETTVTEPEETTSEPEVTTTEPETTVTEPEVTTTEPETTVTEPEETTTEPKVTTTEPEETTPASGDVTVSVSGSSATVSDGKGLSYTATGYRSAAADGFVINQNFVAQLGSSEAANATFNRFSIAYTSTQPLKGVMTYVEDGITKTDSFFLEAGAHTFSCVTRSYLAGEKSSRIVSMTFSTLNGADAKFLLKGLSTYDYPVYGTASGDTYYISNSAYRLGIRLSWGGGINYLYDKRAASVIPGVENLINQADTGRLVQQSYYGAAAFGDYKAGIYNGSQWSYNPVQGGDVYQNHSRIIDIVVSENSVYVKSQPQDWSLNNQLTPSYMENTYTLHSDRVQVDNRFVDYSGMTHPYSHQEVPAFYTLSCFDRFSWYDGSQGWTGGAISYRDNLNFWGDPAYHNDCVFPVKQSNTETWCAWTSSRVNYGIGLYVPNVDTYLAGRFSYDGSTSSQSGSTNYVAPLVNKMLVSYEPIEYSYLITTGSVEQIRATFAQNKSFATNESLHVKSVSMRVADDTPSAPSTPPSSSTPLTLDLTNAGNVGAVTAGNGASIGYSTARSATELCVTAADPYVFLHLPSAGTIATAGYGTLVIEYVIPTDNSRSSYDCDVFVCAGAVAVPDPNCRVRAALQADGQIHQLTINLSQYGYWTGNLNALRFDFFDVAGVGDRIYLRSVTLR